MVPLNLPPFIVAPPRRELAPPRWTTPSWSHLGIRGCWSGSAGARSPARPKASPVEKPAPPRRNSSTEKTTFLSVFMTSRWAPRLLLHLCGSSLPRGGHRFPGRVSGRPRCCPPLRDCPLPLGAFRLPFVPTVPRRSFLRIASARPPPRPCPTRFPLLLRLPPAIGRRPPLRALPAAQFLASLPPPLPSSLIPCSGGV